MSCYMIASTTAKSITYPLEFKFFLVCHTKCIGSYLPAVAHLQGMCSSLS